ncbi:MAG: DUF1015 domain-containing protein [Clostridiales bacterium]|nr:DUF1015 domain-containing protein [Clostridiales bacterium]
MRDGCIRAGELLLPNQTVDLTAWACVACDQYTSQPAYWQEAEMQAGDKPSALRLVLPEIYLDEAAQRIPRIHETMRGYLQNGVLTPRVKKGFVLVERSTGEGARLGLVALMDLECYDYRAGSKLPVHATEGTIMERIPPRLMIRKGAELETSHVLLLIDDRMHSVAEPLFAKRASLEKLYDFPLMMNGGQLTGYAVTDPNDIQSVYDAFGVLKQQGGILFAVGDGNHSLAAAKSYWEEVKQTLTPGAQANHPARFAMVEIENIHDDALCFAPIHRVLFGFDGDDLLSEIESYAVSKGWTLAGAEDTHCITVVYEGKEVELNIAGSGYPLAVGTLQTFLDEWMRGRSGLKLDYVHGEGAARALAAQPNTVAFLLPALHKGELFPAIGALSVLPRKTFSLGEAHEKRYYMETRKLRP